MKISETVLLNKLGLSLKFPQPILYLRKLALGIDLMKLLTIITILLLKLCTEDLNSKDWISKLM